MKLKLFVLLFLVFFISTPVCAIDGEVYLGSFFGYKDVEKNYYLDGDIREPVGIYGVELGHKIKKFRPYIRLETEIDEINNHTVRPGNIKYFMGVEFDIWKDLSGEIYHMCDHAIDRPGDDNVQYNIMIIKYRFGDR